MSPMELNIFLIDGFTALVWILCGWFARSLYQDYLETKSEQTKVWKPSNRRHE